MKKIYSLALIVAILICCFSVFSLNTLAEDKYDDLIAARKEYLVSKYPAYGEFLEKADVDPQIPVPNFNVGGPYWMQSFFEACDLTVLLYTDAIDDMTFEVYRAYETGDYVWSGFDSLFMSHMLFIVSPEIEAATDSCRADFYRNWEAKSPLRACLDYFDISKEELIAANEKMQEDPDCIREYLNMLSDEEFESVRNSNGLFCREPLEDFMIEALYLEEDEMANNLLAMPYSVYVKEFDSMVTVVCMYEYYHSFFYLDPSEYYDLDLTSDFMGDFINILYHSGDIDETNYEVSLILKDARAKQLAVETGEELIFIPLAVVSFAGAVAIVSHNKRKRFN
ncbi:MAG: hypothetical protein E7675_03915 [Ruminococcaceae bacterium]|nr:hypothetical protein [Oscillospiraceae bacterium]